MIVRIITTGAILISNIVAVEANLGKNGEEEMHLTIKNIQHSMQKTHLLYDKKSDQHYNVISALHKSMRGGYDDMLFDCGGNLDIVMQMLLCIGSVGCLKAEKMYVLH